MANNAASQVATRARWLAVPAGAPILASKITAPSVPDWAVQRPRITKLIAQGSLACTATACECHQHKANGDGRLVLARVALKRTAVM